MARMWIDDDVLLVGCRSEAEEGRPLIGIPADGVRGWYSTPSIKTDSVRRVGADGDWSRRQVHYSPRTVTVKMNMFGQSRADHVDMWRMLGRLNRTARKVHYQDEAEDTFITAFLEFDFPSDQATLLSTGSFVATADDPVRYANVEQSLVLMASTTTGGLEYPIEYPIDYHTTETEGQSYGVVTNDGNIEGYPVITVEGNMPTGFTLMDSQGRAITYYGAVYPGTPVVVDCKARAILVQGVNRSWALSRREWFSVPPGGSLGISFIPDRSISQDAASATVQFRSTYI